MSMLTVTGGQHTDLDDIAVEADDEETGSVSRSAVAPVAPRSEGMGKLEDVE
jgi:hypothetical protein